MAVESSGLPMYFRIICSEVHGCKETPKLVAKPPKGDYIIADRGWDSDGLRIQIKKQKDNPCYSKKK